MELLAPSLAGKVKRYSAVWFDTVISARMLFSSAMLK